MRNWVFDLQTGEAQGADEGRVRVWDIIVEDNRVMITQDVLGQERVSA